MATPSLTFDVVSIRPSKPGGSWSVRWGTTPDGYVVKGQSLRATIMIAYFPQGFAYWSNEPLSGAPSWLDDLYDVDAKVSEANLAGWQNQGLLLEEKPMLQQMLQAMLAERCKFVFHRVPTTIPGYALEIAKQGSKLVEAKPGEPLPKGIQLAHGGVLIPNNHGERAESTFTAATMGSFAAYLSQISFGHPVRDETGLAGKYNFVLSWVSLNPDEREGSVNSNDPDPLSHWDLQKLGLRVRPVRIPAETLVIDHIEKPSEN